MQLTSKQEKFCQNIINGMSQVDAYRDAYPSSLKWKDNSVYCKASLLKDNVKVVQRIDELNVKIDERLVANVSYTREMSIAKFQQIQALALTPQGQWGTLDLGNANRSEKHIGELSNFYQDKQDINIAGTGNIQVNIVLGGKDGRVS